MNTESVPENAIKTRLFKPMLRFVFSFSFICVLSQQAVVAQEYKKMVRVGTSESVCQGGVESISKLQSFVAKNPAAIHSILQSAGWQGDAQQVIGAVAQGNVREVSYPTGTKMAWSGAKVNGQYVAKPFREWAGKKPLQAYQISVSSACKVYEMAFIKDCCNLSLMAVTEDVSAACKPVETVSAPASAVVEEEVYEVVSEPVQVSKAPLKWIPIVGLFGGSETRPRFETQWQMDKKDASGIYGLKLGMMRELSSKNSVFAQLSYYRRTSINEYNVYPRNNIALDVGFERKLSEFAFIGAGIGAWNLDDSDFRDASLFAHLGGNIAASNFQWFLEGRIFDTDSDLDSISDNKMFSLGVRYRIK